MNSKQKLAAIKAIKEAYPNINWDRFEDMDRALNWELWHGPLPENYWTEVEPLDHYEWQGWVQAQKDIEEILEPLPHEVWFDLDGEMTITTKNPEDDDDNWWKPEDEDDENGAWEWAGGEWAQVNVREILMYAETFKQVF